MRRPARRLVSALPSSGSSDPALALNPNRNPIDLALAPTLHTNPKPKPKPKPKPNSNPNPNPNPTPNPNPNPNPAPILSCRPDGYPYSPHPETMSNTSALNVRKHGWVGSSGDKHPGLLQLDGMMVLLLALLVKQLGGKPCAHEAKACYDA